MSDPPQASQDIGSTHWTLPGCGLAIFLVSLSILFAAGMIGLAYLRLSPSGSTGITPSAGVAPAAVTPVHPVPVGLWYSTGLLLLVSFTLHWAVVAARKGQSSAFRVWLVAAGVLALAFLANQVPALVTLLESHQAMMREVERSLRPATQPTFVTDPRRYLLGLMFFLIFLHALHVVGGLAALGRVLVRAAKPSQGDGLFASIRFAAIYWHFLDVVWLIMFTGFLLL